MNGLSRHYGRDGFTLIEVLIASSLIAVVMGIGVHCLLAGMGVSARTLTQGSVQEQTRQSLERMASELKDSGEGCTGWAIGLNPNPVNQFYDQNVTRMTFSPCTGYDTASDVLTWGVPVTLSYQAVQGAERGKVVRTKSGVQTTICDAVTDFHMQYISIEGRVQMTLTVVRNDPQSPGHLIEASHTTSVKLRN